MNILKTFLSSHSHSKYEIYVDVNDRVNQYAKETNLNVENVSYERIDNTVIANVLFSEVDTEKQEDSLIQSYRNERQLLFDSFNKQNETACDIIELLLNCIDGDRYSDIKLKAEQYLISHKYNKEIMNNTIDEK